MAVNLVRAKLTASEMFESPFMTRIPRAIWFARLSAFAVTLHLGAAAQAAPLTVQTVQYKGRLPYVLAADAKVAARINHAVFLDTIDMAAPLKLSDGVRDRKKTEGLEPISDINYQVLRNDARLLVLAVEYEGCGAYCEHREINFNFDAATGRSLLYSDLITAAGREKLDRQLEARRVARVNAEIARLRAGIQAAQKKLPPKAKENRLEPEDAEAVIEMYQGCIKLMTDPENAKYRTIDGDSFRIGKDAITFYWGRCSNHAMRALDEIGDFADMLTIKELSPQLTAYGRALLLGEGSAISAGGPFDQILTGKVGSAPITLKLGKRNPDGSIGGSYFYDKYRTPITFFGRITGDVLEVEETTGDNKVAPVIRATISGGGLKGTWTGNGKQLAFDVSP